MGDAPARRPRLAMLALPGLDHFVQELAAALAEAGGPETRLFLHRDAATLEAALAWADAPARDAIWFEFCWPPFPALIAATDFGGRRVLMRLHRVEAFDTNHAATAPWHKVDDAILVAEDLKRRLLEVAPAIEATTRLHVVHNGLDLARFRPAAAPDPFRIGWCGWLNLRKNPSLALEVLYRLRARDPRWQLHMATRGAEPVALESFAHLARRMGVAGAIHVQEGVPQSAMPEWHARNAVLLSTSLHESFGYAIAEAASVGCDLAVLDFPAAGEFWPEAVRFGTAEEAVRLIEVARPHRWRDWVAARYGLDRQVAALLDILAPPPGATAGERTVPVAHGAWRGRFPLRDSGDHVQRSIAATGRFYEAALLEDLRGRLPPGAVFLDIGANVGNHALFAAGVCGARVVACEPAPALAEHCAATLALNGLSDRMELHRCGLGAAPGRAALLPGPPGNAGMTRLAPAPEGEVEVTTLDALAERLEAPPAVIKVDVEGMESEVLRGGLRTFGRCRPALYVETATAAFFLEVEEVLAPLGYAPVARFNATPTWLFLPG